MDRGDGFWTSGNKGWKTRREQQDAYRKALDEQIQQRKKLDDQRRDKHKGKGPPESPKIADPVKHLLPWMSLDDSQQVQSQAHIPDPQAHQAQAQAYQVLPPPPSGPTNYYYVANPSLPPLGASGSGSVESVGQGQAVQQPPFGYYGAMQIPPPPPNYMGVPGPGPGPVQMPAYPVQMVGQPQQMFVVPPGYGSPNPNPGIPPVAPSASAAPPNHAEKDKGADEILHRQAEQDKGQEDTKKEMQKHPTEGQRRIPKVHVSQTFEELHPQQSLDQYRQELTKQIEDKKRQEEERQKRDLVEEEKMQRRIREDQERLKYEYEEDLRRKALKDEEDKRRQQDQLRTLELARKKLEEQTMLNRQRQTKGQASKNSHAAQSSSPGRYYHRDGSWSWDSRPIPVVERLCKNGELPVRDDDEDEDKEKPESARSNVNKTPVVQSQSACDVHHHHHHHGTVKGGQSRPDSQPNSASSSKTYSISEHGDRDRDIDHHEEDLDEQLTPRAMQMIPTGKSKSTEEVGKGQGQSHPLTLHGPGQDVIMCPKCSKSFSSSDVQYPKSEIERQRFLNCLENIQRRLREDKERLVRGGFQWNR